MKKLFAVIAVFGMLSMGASSIVFAQDNAAVAEPATEEVDSSAAVADSGAVAEEVAPVAVAEETPAETPEEEPKGLHQEVKRLFIEGGPAFMSFVLLTLILGLAIAIERIIYLNLASTNTEKLVKRIEEALNSGGVDAAKELCRNTRGPVASIFYQGLDRYDESKENNIELVEKTVISYGGVQMGLLEKGLTWISLFISLAPMLGFMGTVIGMIFAFDAIEAAGDISPSLVAGGIKVALITTVSGLVVAMILQLAYNYIVSKIDGIVNRMEDASISLIDLLVKHNLKK